MTIADKLLTVDEYVKAADPDRPTELVGGKIVVMNAPGFRHGVVCNNLGFILKLHARKLRIGRLLNNDSGVVTARNPDTVRAPDVAFYSFSRVPPDVCPLAYVNAVPEVVLRYFRHPIGWPKPALKSANIWRPAFCWSSPLTRRIERSEPPVKIGRRKSSVRATNSISRSSAIFAAS